MTLVDQILDLDAAKRNASARLANMCHSFSDGLFPLDSGRFPFSQALQGAGDDLLGALIAAGAKVSLYKLLNVRVKGEAERHTSG
jgi:hypothetical protein